MSAGGGPAADEHDATDEAAGQLVLLHGRRHRAHAPLQALTA